MAEIRGERLSFSRKEIVPLHDLPSAQAEDPIIVHCPPPRSSVKRTCKALLFFVMLVLVACGSAIFAIEGGAVDSALSSRAQTALNDAIGPRYTATVGATVLRFDSDMRLALEARDVDIVEKASGQHLSRAGAMRIAIDPLALLGGHVSIKHIEADAISIDMAHLPSGDPVPLSQVRIDAMPALLEQAFQRLDEANGLIERTGTSSMTISGIDLVFPAAPGESPLTLVVDDLVVTRNEQGVIEVKGEVNLDGRPAELTASATAVHGVASALSARLSGLDATPFLLQRTADGAPREGLTGSLDLDLSAVRAREHTQPSISAVLRQSAGEFYFDGIAQEFSGAEINVAYDFAKNSIEVLPSQARFGPTVLPITGAVVDLNRLDPGETRPGFGLDLLVSGGSAAAANSDEEPTRFDLKAGGRYLSAARELQVDDMLVSSPRGTMAGSLMIRFGEQSPEISFGARLPSMEVTGVKQLWPFWMARKPRDWVAENMFGGMVTNGSIAVFIPAGRMQGPGVPLELDENELRISFDVTDARLNLPDEIPPLRDIAAHFDLKGEKLAVGVASAKSYLPSGRTLTVGGGTFAIASTYSKPLMADLAINISGAADALTELADYKPINALKGTGFKPQDFAGSAKADIEARFGLISDHHPPKPTWDARVDLNGVDLLTEFSGHKLSNLTGSLNVDTEAARLAVKGTVDDIPADITLVEPVDSQSKVQRERVVKATLNDQQREKIAPGLSEVVEGPIEAELTRLDDKRQAVVLDLTRATLSVPVLGWTKGGGIGAKAKFEFSEEAGRTDIRNFDLSGEGFGAAGNLTLADGSLTSAEFSRLRLSPLDDYAVSLKRTKGNYDVSISGSAADIRPVISRLKSGSSGKGGKTGGATVRAKLDRLVGFGDESISNVSLLFSVRNGDISSADFSGVTGSRQAVVSQMTRGDTISITSGDAGAVARFMDLYDNMRGGLLNLRLRAQPGDAWTGSIDVRSFSLINEARLQSMVSTPVGKDGRSLNSAVKRDIDVSSARFQRGFARLVYRDGGLAVDNGVVRGEQIGATFQGVLRDGSGNMSMTGTFMPAYGLNRLFAELPVIGIFLGNGTDRGLLGITFKLEGRFDKPKLVVNPLSLIAPGVFRQIFEFQ
jgi:hypothetical protein